MKKPQIIHILADGKRVKTIEGHVIPADNPVYKIIMETSLTKMGESEKAEKLA